MFGFMIGEASSVFSSAINWTQERKELDFLLATNYKLPGAGASHLAHLDLLAPFS